MRVLPLATALCLALVLNGCASVDKSLFGNAAPAAEPSTTPAPESTADDESAGANLTSTTPAAAAPDADSASGAGGLPGTLPSTAPGDTSVAPVTPPPPPEAAASAASPGEAPAPSVPARSSAGSPVVGSIAVVPGLDTGTAPNHTMAGVRASLQDASSRVTGAGQQYATLRANIAQQLAAYYQAEGQITAQLQIGTTRGNPELVAHWNAAQAALDQLTSAINSLSTLSAQIGGEATRVRSLLAQIEQARQTAGAIEEDQRQAAVLEDEANQIVVVLDRLARDSSADLRRQTAILSAERNRLTQLANGIKAGDTSGAAAPARVAPSSPAFPSGAAASGQPITSLSFGRGQKNYQKKLYDALSQALQGQPSASFRVVGVSPTRASAAGVQTAQSDARRRAQEVMRTMTEMGVPANRMELSSATDPAARGTQVRVYIR